MAYSTRVSRHSSRQPKNNRESLSSQADSNTVFSYTLPLCYPPDGDGGDCSDDDSSASIFCFQRKRDSSVTKKFGPDFDCRQGYDLFSYLTAASRRARGLTQLPLKQVQDLFAPWYIFRSFELTTQLSLAMRIKCPRLYFRSPYTLSCRDM
jgi:hypothetical protein